MFGLRNWKSDSEVAQSRLLSYYLPLVDRAPASGFSNKCRAELRARGALSLRGYANLRASEIKAKAGNAFIFLAVMAQEESIFEFFFHPSPKAPRPLQDFSFPGTERVRETMFGFVYGGAGGLDGVSVRFLIFLLKRGLPVAPGDIAMALERRPQLVPHMIDNLSLPLESGPPLPRHLRIPSPPTELCSRGQVAHAICCILNYAGIRPSTPGDHPPVAMLDGYLHLTTWHFMHPLGNPKIRWIPDGGDGEGGRWKEVVTSLALQAAHAVMRDWPVHVDDPRASLGEVLNPLVDALDDRLAIHPVGCQDHSLLVVEGDGEGGGEGGGEPPAFFQCDATGQFCRWGEFKEQIRHGMVQLIQDNVPGGLVHVGGKLPNTPRLTHLNWREGHLRGSFRKEWRWLYEPAP